MRAVITASAVLALVACAATEVAAPLRHPADRNATILPGSEVIDLGTLGGQRSLAWGVNSAGAVVGWSSLRDSEEAQAFIWQSGTMSALEALPTRASPTSIAYSINASGQIAREARTRTGTIHAVRWDAGKIQDLGALGGDSASSVAYRLNDAGQVVGLSTTTSGAVHAFVWKHVTMHDLGTLPGGSYSVALGINAAGHIVGDGAISSGEFHAVLWRDGAIQDLGTLGGRYSSAHTINDAGQVVGWSNTASGVTHAFLWEEGIMYDLGSLPHVDYSSAFGINASGQVVGQLGGGRTFLWSASDGMEELSAGIGLLGAYDINGLKVVGYLPNFHAGLVNVKFSPSQP